VTDRRVLFHPAAQEEADRAREWYAARSKVAAAGFISDLEHAVGRVREAPERWPRIAGGMRRYVFPRYPFNLVYRVTPEFVEIVAVAHHRRQPGYWISR
jgi:plasmid stabilization system protein ParE